MSAEPARHRLLVFVVAYQAETTLKQVLDRVPDRLFRDYECEILVIDDGSKDRTYDIGQEYRKEHPGTPLTVRRNELNQGYGGNQKIGYAYAVAEAFDLVALLHGDAQYAPEELPNLCAPIRSGDADAVFGSRMLTPGGARQGGMPLYKYIGNKVLTKIQNAVLGTALSEFHSGFRVYSVKALSRVPFHLNSNEFHFDTEIIIQLMNSGARIIEVPIPTYYGNEISRVNGLKYAKDVLTDTFQNAAHRAGILYQRRFDTGPTAQKYGLKLGYPSSHTYAMQSVPPGAKVVDIGGGSGALAQELSRKGCEVCVVDRNEPIRKPSNVQFHSTDLDAGPPEVAGYSHILLLDIIEHLESPERFMDELRAQFTYTTQTLIISVPNIGFASMRLQLLLGQFNYHREGILDMTHRRLFTFGSLLRLIRDSGLKVRDVRGVPAPFPKAIGDGPLARALLAANTALIRLSKPLFSYQIFIVAESTPDVQFLLKRALMTGRPDPRSPAVLSSV